jgi:phytanoyl-CoA hydroxylase
MNLDVSSYKENGYIKIENFFSKKEIILIFKKAQSVFLKQFYYKNYVSTDNIDNISELEFNQYLYRLYEEDKESLMNCGKQVQHLIDLHKLSLNSKIEHLLNEVGLKEPNISTRPVMYFNNPMLAKKKVYHTVDAHQDWRSMQGSLNSVVIWIPLIDINKDLGALQILPKSHLDGLRTDFMENGFGMVKLTEEEKKRLKSVEVKTGDILLFSSFLIHQSGDNITKSPRWSCHFRYNDLAEKTFIQRKFAHPYIYKPQDTLITENFPTKDSILKIFS